MARKLLFEALILSTLSIASIASSSQNSTQLVLTSRENGTETQGEFSCNGRIHGYLTFPQKIVGKHVLESKWILPTKAVAQHTSTALDFPPPGKRTAYIWLQFDADGTLQKFLPISDKTDDNNRLAYNGPWRVEVYWDGQLLTQSSFQVRC